MEYESKGDTNCNSCSRYDHQKIDKVTGGLGNKRKIEDQPNYGIVKIDQNTEKSRGHLRRLVVAQTPVGNHQLMLV